MTGAPPHYGIHKCEKHIKVNFGQRWIDRKSPARSPDLLCMDFFFWGHMKIWVCETPFPPVEDPIARLSVPARRIRNMPGILKN
ncbi:hypothetical protein TNCV_14561, partial [Trichonephila clavipes]